MEIYLVGGAVRDRLLGIGQGDRDWVVVGATAEEMDAAGYRAVGRDFPVFLHPETREEYALARTERKSGRGYKGFVFNTSPEVTLEDDLARRDLTINAIAEDSAGNLVDPYGGARDLEQRILRHVSPAFVEDPLRVLRVARFAARFAGMGFRIAPETLALMRAIADGGELQDLVAERVWQEMDRALQEPTPAVFFRTLRECDALASILPELDALFGVPQPEQHHPEVDTGEHSLMSLEQAARLSSSVAVRFAALIHDLGKGLTPAEQWPHHYGHEEAGVPLIDQRCEHLRVPREPCRIARLCSRFHTRCHQLMQMRAAKILDLLEGIDAFRRPEQMEAVLLACEADARGRTGFEDRAYPQAERLRHAREAAHSLDVPSLITDMDKRDGDAIKQRIRQARIQRIRQALAGEDE